MNFSSTDPAILGGIPAFKEPVQMVRPSLPTLNDISNRIEEVLRSGQITNAKYVEEFEDRTSQYLGIKHCVAVSSCTLGLMLVQKALDLSGEVILPSFTFAATGHSVIWSGLKPVFVDCLKDSCNIDPVRVEDAITEETSAILAVHIFGNPADADALADVASRYDLRLIFDAAHGFGARYRGKQVGVFGDAEVFSLSPTKLLTTGEGGLVATNDDELARAIRIGRNYGDPGDYDCEFAGFNSRMPEWNAIVGIKSLEFLEENVERRNRIAELYRQGLEVLPGVSFQLVDPADRSTYKDFSVFVDGDEFGMNRDVLALALDGDGIQTRKYFFPSLHKMKALRLASQGSDLDMPVTEWLSSNVISLPIYYSLTDDQVEGICEAICRIYRHGAEIKAHFVAGASS